MLIVEGTVGWCVVSLGNISYQKQLCTSSVPSKNILVQPDSLNDGGCSVPAHPSKMNQKQLSTTTKKGFIYLFLEGHTWQFSQFTLLYAQGSLLVRFGKACRVPEQNLRGLYARQMLFPLYCLLALENTYFFLFLEWKWLDPQHIK